MPLLNKLIENLRMLKHLHDARQISMLFIFTSNASCCEATCNTGCYIAIDSTKAWMHSSITRAWTRRSSTKSQIDVSATFYIDS